MRTATAILSTANLLNNLKVIKNYAPGAKIIGLVKANGYGHGLRSVAVRAEQLLDIIGVASIDEALILRNVGVKKPIMLMEGVFEPSELLIASVEKFEVVFHIQHQLEWLKEARIPVPISAWLKIDTGMGRLGFSDLLRAREIYDEMCHLKQIINPIKIISHLACAEKKDHPLNLQQINAFNNFIADIDSKYSLCNSAALFNWPEYHYDFVRPGLSMYGVSPFESISASQLGLKPVMTLQSTIIAIKNMKKGSSVGYCATFVCPEDMPVAIVAFGYGDGYPRTAVRAPVLIRDVICNTIGNVSMDMMAVDIRNLPDAKIGEQVILWGDGLPIEEVAKHSANIVFDLLTGVQNRVKFYWTKE